MIEKHETQQKMNEVKKIMKEIYLEKLFVTEARDRGFIVIKGAAGEHKGIPDRQLIGFDGTVCFVELKVRSNKLSPEQKNWKRELERRGFRHFVIRAIDEFQPVWDYLNGYEIRY